jgi:hypothetical protein
MAHYKRGRCRYLGKSRRSSRTFIRKRWGMKPIKLPHDWWELDIPTETLWPTSGGYWWSSSYPRSWDIQHHSRPRRAQERRLARLAVMDRIDFDEMIWPLSKKPHIYYW